MIDRGRFRTLLGLKAEGLSNEEVGLVRDAVYSLAHLLLRWDKQHTEASSKKIPAKGGENKCL